MSLSSSAASLRIYNSDFGKSIGSVFKTVGATQSGVKTCNRLVYLKALSQDAPPFTWMILILSLQFFTLQEPPLSIGRSFRLLRQVQLIRPTWLLSPSFSLSSMVPV